MRVAHDVAEVVSWLDAAASRLNPRHELQHRVHCDDVSQFARVSAAAPAQLRRYWRRAVWSRPAEPALVYFVRCLAHHGAVTLLSPHLSLFNAADNDDNDNNNNATRPTAKASLVTTAQLLHAEWAVAVHWPSRAAGDACSRYSAESYGRRSDSGGAASTRVRRGGPLRVERCRVVGHRMQHGRTDVVQTGWLAETCPCERATASATTTAHKATVDTWRYARRRHDITDDDDGHDGTFAAALPTRYGGGVCAACGAPLPRAAVWCRRYFVVLQRCDGSRRAAVAYGDAVGGALQLGCVLDMLVYDAAASADAGAMLVIHGVAAHTAHAPPPPPSCTLPLSLPSLDELAECVAPELVGQGRCKRLVLLSVLHTLYCAMHACNANVDDADDDAAWLPLHILLVGTSRCGKTTLLQRTAALYRACSCSGRVEECVMTPSTTRTTTMTTAAAAAARTAVTDDTTALMVTGTRDVFASVVARGRVRSGGAVSACTALLVDGVADGSVDGDAAATLRLQQLTRLLQHGFVCYDGASAHAHTGSDGGDSSSVDVGCAWATTGRGVSPVQVTATAHSESSSTRALLGSVALVAQLQPTQSLDDTTRIGERVLSSSRARATSTWRRASRSLSCSLATGNAGGGGASDTQQQQRGQDTQQQQQQGRRQQASFPRSGGCHGTSQARSSVSCIAADDDEAVSLSSAADRLAAYVRHLLQSAPPPAVLQRVLREANVHAQVLCRLCAHWPTLERVAVACACGVGSSSSSSISTAAARAMTTAAPAPASLRCGDEDEAHSSHNSNHHRHGSSSSGGAGAGADGNVHGCSGDVLVPLQKHARVMYALCLARLLLPSSPSHSATVWQASLLDEVWLSYACHLRSVAALYEGSDAATFDKDNTACCRSGSARCRGDAVVSSTMAWRSRGDEGASCAPPHSGKRLRGSGGGRRGGVLRFVAALQRAQGAAAVVTEDDAVCVYRACDAEVSTGDVYFALMERLQQEGVLLRRPGGWRVMLT